MLKTRTHYSKEGQTIPPKTLLLSLCLSVLWSSGCVTPAKRPAAVHFPAAVLVRPIIPQATAGSALVEAPDIPLDIASPPERLGPPRNPPARPHVAAAPAPEPQPTERGAEPIIAPELSDDQVATAKIETQRSLLVANRNLALTQGKRLNSAQGDLASKVRGFMETSRDAMKNGDWPRARNSAKKAEVLSQELANSL
jgi:hypothetical protein